MARSHATLTLPQVQARIIECHRCPRLRTYCAEVARTKKAAHRTEDYWGRPVPGFGDPDARLLVLGLAPAAHGANRTGRLFTGDSSGQFLMRALHRAGFANIPTSERAGDGLVLRDAFISAAARCAPPDNKPTPAELVQCLDHLDAETQALGRLRIVVALGRVAFDAWLALEKRRGARRRPTPAFSHAGVHHPGAGLWVVTSYHPSRQNTNTGRLTEEMFDEVFRAVRNLLAAES
jgi:uracil-DNA glycosylase family 4